MLLNPASRDERPLSLPDPEGIWRPLPEGQRVATERVHDPSGRQIPSELLLVIFIVTTIPRISLKHFIVI